MDELVVGFYRGKPINAVLLDGTTDTVRRFEYANEPGAWYFPLIAKGENVEKDKFEISGIEQLTLF